MRWAPFGAEAAANANRFILHHDGAYSCRDFFRSKMLQQNGIGSRKFREPLLALLTERELFQWDQLQTIFRAYIHATAAKNAFSPIRFIPFEDRVDPALQAAGSFRACLLFRIAGLDFGDSRAAVQRNSGNLKARVLVVSLRHAVM